MVSVASGYDCQANYYTLESKMRGNKDCHLVASTSNQKRIGSSNLKMAGHQAVDISSISGICIGLFRCM